MTINKRQIDVIIIDHRPRTCTRWVTDARITLCGPLTMHV